jgi:hypothetical protein
VAAGFPSDGHTQAHHLDMAGQIGAPAGAGSIPPAQQPAAIPILIGAIYAKLVIVLAVRQSGLAGATLDLPAASGR